MQYLDTVAHEFAKLKADADYQEYMVSVTEAVGATLSDEKSVDKRKWDARASPAYSERLEALRRAKEALWTIEAKREAARIKVDVWRTIHADKRARDIPEPGRR